MFRKTASIAVSALVTAGLVAGSIVGVASAASAVETPKATIDGVLSLGATLTAKATDFVELPATFTYEWVNYTENPTAVIGRLSTYTPNSGDRGDDLIVTIKSPTETATSPTALVGGGTLSTGQSSVVPGASYSVSGTFFAPSVDYVIDAGTNKIPVKSDASGNFTVSIPVATTEKAGTKSVSAVHATAGKISSTTIIVTQPPKPPVIKGSSPTISGTVQVNKTIRASVGSWSKGVTFDYQWLLDSKPIPGEINSTYSIRPTDVGHSIRLRLLGQADDAALTVTSSGYKVAAAKYTATPSVAIKGKQKVGRKLKAVVSGTFSPGAAGYSYQWYSNGTAISGATSKLLKVKKSWKGKVLSVRLTGKQLGFETVTRTAYTGKIKKK